MLVELYQFSLLGQITFITAIVVISAAILSMIKLRFNYNSILFGVMNFFVFCWLFCFSLAYSAIDKDTAFWWFNFAFHFIPFIPASTYLFITSFLESTKFRTCLKFTFIAIAIFFMLSQIVNQAVYSELHLYSWGFYNIHHLSYGIAFVLFLTGVMSISITELILAYKSTPKDNVIKRKRLKILTISVLIASMGGVDFLPSYYVDIIPFGFLFIFTYTILFYYAVQRYHILDFNRYVAKTIIETMMDALVVCDLDGIIHKVNHSTLEYTNYEKNELLDKKFSNILMKDNSDSKGEIFISFLRRKELTTHFDALIKKKDSSLIPVSISAAAIVKNHKYYGWVIIAHDISDYKKSIEQLTYLSNHDYLTGIYNRKYFEENLQYHIKYALRNNFQSALLLFDVDHFKHINDTHGHQCGDEVLIEFCKRIKSCIRELDIIGRMGGDEFAVIVTNINEKDVHKIAKKLLKSIGKTPFKFNGKLIHLSSSIGVTIFPSQGHQLETLFTNADIALYECKKNNRNTYKIFES